MALRAGLYWHDASCRVINVCLFSGTEQHEERGRSRRDSLRLRGHFASKFITPRDSFSACLHSICSALPLRLVSTASALPHQPCQMAPDQSRKTAHPYLHQ